ncbi:MAG: efflux RND transporter permease subunit [Rubellimicrobium sp.]|nr:efflux RND transporter permease subunit [Rubellimicrobium sp.]
MEGPDSPRKQAPANALSARAGGILSYFVRHKTVANLLMVLMLAAGLLALPQMRTQFFPDVVVDNITVSVSWPGAGAEDVDAAIVQVLEPALLNVEGVTSTQASSSEGRAAIRLEFDAGYDMDRANEDVLLAVDAVRDLPADADDPQVRRSGWSDRVTDVVIHGPVGVDQLGRIADEMVARLFAAGVTRATIMGVAAPSTIVEVPSLSLIQHDIGLSDISAAIAREVSADPAGEVTGTARIRTGSPSRSAEDIAAIALRRDADGATLTIGDVAHVRVEGIDRERAFFVGDNPAIKIQVDRSAQGDAIRLEDAVRLVRLEAQATVPAGVQIDLVNSRAEAISGRIGLLVNNGLLGLALVVGLLFLFLNARTAFWVAAGIPIAMLAGLFFMWLAGLTINMMSLFALILMLGIVVDDAIVVGEHADFRRRTLGEDPFTAAENAARRMFTPVLAASITTVIAFLGLIVISGRFGDLIAAIPYTVTVVILASLVECFLILPHHMAHAGAGAEKAHWYDWPSRQVNRGFNWFSRRVFRPFMGLVVWARYPVLAFGIFLLANQTAQVIRGDVTWRFFSAPEQGSVSGNFVMLPSATRDDSLAMMRELQRATDALGAELEARDGVNPLIHVVAEIGGNSGRALAGSEDRESWQLGAITIQLIDADQRPYSSTEFVMMLQENIRQHPMAETVSFRSWGQGPGGDDISVRIVGADADTLKTAAEALKAELAQFPEISGLDDSQPFDKEELILNLTPQGQALGFTIDALGRSLRDRLNGIEAATFPDGPRSASIRVELPPHELTSDFLDRTLLRAAAGDHVPLGDIVTVERRTGFSTVRRENGIMLVSVTGDLADDNPERAAEVMRSLRDDILPALETRFGIETQLSGLSEQEDQFLNDARTGLILCLAGIFLVLAWVFGSWTRPLVVMAVIPFGLIGAIWGHAHWGIPMSMFTVVGLLGMIGIIINDSIVLTTTIDEYARTRGRIPAIIDGTVDRLRPVFLTTATTVLGLTPLLYEGSNQAEFLKPTVVTLVYGLAAGMFLVLLIVPAILAMQHDLEKQVAAARRALGQGAVWPARIAGLAAAALFAALILPVILTGAAWPALADLLPALAGGAGSALGLFALALLVVLVAVYLVTAALALMRSRGESRT